MISRVIKCWIWLANGLIALPMMTRWMNGRHTDWNTYRAAREHSRISCLIKRFVSKREGKMMAWWVFFNKLSLSRFNIPGPYRGHQVLVASFCCCQHAEAKHPLGLSLSFFIVLFFFFLYTLSLIFSSSPTFTPSWFSLLFSISEMKASPQLFSFLLKRPKWGSLSDEYSPLPL